MAKLFLTACSGIDDNIMIMRMAYILHLVIMTPVTQKVKHDVEYLADVRTQSTTD